MESHKSKTYRITPTQLSQNYILINIFYLKFSTISKTSSPLLKSHLAQICTANLFLQKWFILMLQPSSLDRVCRKILGAQSGAQGLYPILRMP